MVTKTYTDHFCDRCGQKYERADGDDVHLKDLMARSPQYEFCKQCMKEFKQWLNPKKKK